ncbi:Hypothetical protein R9X50_00437000 [Acrodontium crateriforme]|uniref:Rhodopsin domain-containing protein n=1 Tax=Acrodontium crateriforme TaxID=150365 RepID=A0AAQ3M5A3_9PEZI|nr:Hypothetical protein R9X50_00437000 [Acrodontium crateriforme]
MAPPSPAAYGGEGALLLGITWAEATLATLIISARTYAATRLVDRTGWGLFWILLTWIMAITAQILLTISVMYGAGNHTSELTYNDMVQAIKWNWMGQLVAILAIGFAKIAVIALTLHIQAPSERRYSWVLHFIWITNMMINITEVVLILYQCFPVARLWDMNVQGVCNGRQRSAKVGFFQGSWGAASDIVLALYPMFVFYRLNVSLRRKIFLSALMGGGSFAAVAGISKTVYIKNGPTTTDPTYQIYPLWISTYTEMWLILMLSSIPQLRIFFVRQVKQSASVLRSSFIQRRMRRKQSSGSPQPADQEPVGAEMHADERLPIEVLRHPARNDPSEIMESFDDLGARRGWGHIFVRHEINILDAQTRATRDSTK